MKKCKVKKSRLLGVLLLFLIACSANAQTWQQVWSDEFNGPTLDANTWNIEVNADGGFNNELQYYTARPENIRIENGILIIEGRKETYTSNSITRSYTSARINSEGKKSFKYGRMEAKMKLPYGTGMWPAFWMMGNVGEWPACGEIDILEMVGGDVCSDCADNMTHGYMWWDNNGTNQTSGTSSTPLTSGKYADAYHIFAVEWDDQSIKWFVDDNLFHSESITESAKSEFHQSFYFLLNLAIGGDWPGSPNATTVFPQRLYIDYVKVYEKSTCSVPSQPGTITGSTSVAPGSSQTYSVSAVSGATSYTWTLPSGWSGSSSTNSISTTAGSVGGTISVSANNACGSSTARTLSVTVSCSAPAQPGAISGNASVTSGSTQTYSVSAVSGATSYTWTLPSGWSGSSTTTSINATAGSVGGTISVRANNACGSSTARTLSVTVTGTPSGNLALNKTTTTSSIEGAGLEGSKAVDGSGTTRWASAAGVDPQWIRVDLGSSYDISRVKIVWEAAYASAYQVQVSPDGTSWSSIKTVTGNTTLTNDWTGLTGTGRYVRINGTARGTVWGYSIYELEVYGTSGCSVPVQPGVISGSTSVSAGSNQTYSIAAVSGATSYTWMLPSGWSGSSTTTSISATAGSAGGTISVTANNACGASVARTLAVSVSGGGFTLRVEAENYQYMAGVTKVTCSEGGQNISSFDATDWMSYPITIPTAGTYTASFRVSATTTGKSIRFEKDDGATLLATVSVNNTGGAQIWTTVSQNVTLPAGSYSVGLATATGGVNINWFELTSATGREVAMNTNENEEAKAIVFPTLVDHTLYLKTSGEFKNSQVNIVDEVGKEFDFKKIDEGAYDVSALPSGLYILRLTNGYKLLTAKFIKK